MDRKRIYEGIFWEISYELLYWIWSVYRFCINIVHIPCKDSS